MMSDLSGLNILLKATSKSSVERCLSYCFTSRWDNPKLAISSIKSLLKISDEEAVKLYDAMTECIDEVMQTNDIEALVIIFQKKGEMIDQRLKSLIGQLIGTKLESWRQAAITNRVSLPKLVNVDWTVHVEKASSELEVEQPQITTKAMPGTRKIGFELNSASLETMLQGLNKIRDQLSSMS